MSEKSRRLFCVLLENQHDLAGNPACYACYPTIEWAERGMAQADTIWPDRAKYISRPLDGPLEGEALDRAIGRQDKLF